MCKAGTYPGKTQEGTVSPLANKETVKEKVEMHRLPARKMKACPNIYRKNPYINGQLIFNKGATKFYEDQKHNMIAYYQNKTTKK